MKWEELVEQFPNGREEREYFCWGEVNGLTGKPKKGSLTGGTRLETSAVWKRHNA